ncbi:MAG TPA: type II secretion system major pseudopilin GspG [Chthonomonadaceae bacterium]|nr:type II secretion system major pseudopilin GspG [Chthonomonadaceae bacterium]
MRERMLRRRARGFTLIELIVVIIILAVLAAVVIPNVIHRTDDARVSSAIATIQSFDTALDLYRADTGQYPTVEQGLNVLITNPGVPKWNGPYLKNQSSIPLDPWNHPYVYRQPGSDGREYEISSTGPDGQPGTNDDIQSWNLQKK